MKDIQAEYLFLSGVKMQWVGRTEIFLYAIATILKLILDYAYSVVDNHEIYRWSKSEINVLIKLTR